MGDWEGRDGGRKRMGDGERRDGGRKRGTKGGRVERGGRDIPGSPTAISPAPIVLTGQKVVFFPLLITKPFFSSF